MDKVLSNDKIDNVGALVLNDNKLTKVDLKDFSVSKKKIFSQIILKTQPRLEGERTMFSDNDEIRIFVD